MSLRAYHNDIKKINSRPICNNFEFSKSQNPNIIKCNFKLFTAKIQMQHRLQFLNLIIANFFYPIFTPRFAARGPQIEQRGPC